jgi:hypothetical protein
VTFNIRQSQLRTLKPSDPNFYVSDGFFLTARAGFEVSTKCPTSYAIVIQECINHGWLTPVANMSERELLIIGLTKDE